jgi:hypothetical protein
VELLHLLAVSEAGFLVMIEGVGGDIDNDEIKG